MLTVACQQCCLQTLWNLQHKSVGGLKLRESTIEGSIFVLMQILQKILKTLKQMSMNKVVWELVYYKRPEDNPFKEVSAENMPAKRYRGTIYCSEYWFTCKNLYLLRKHISSNHNETTQKEPQCSYCLVLFEPRRIKAGHMRHCKAIPSRKK